MNDHFVVSTTEGLLQQITRLAVEHFHPEKIILFGSHAWGTPHPDSDIDLLVIMKSTLRPIQRAVQFREVCRPKFVSMDVLVRTPEEIQERLVLGIHFIKKSSLRGESSMKLDPLIIEWIEKAEADLKAAIDLSIGAPPCPFSSP
ncbi:MAG: nucleotidyltransferase domain-containing protein, partial [bacterium]